jgi:ankyrin repeat protein
VTVQELVAAVAGADREKVKTILASHPELVNTDLAANDERRALHFAVWNRSPEMVRLLMEYGADARKGIYPHRDATSALTMASERGYDEIVEIINNVESRRAPDRNSEARSAEAESPARAAVKSGNLNLLLEQHARGSLSNELDDTGGLLTLAVEHDQQAILSKLLDFGWDPNEPVRVRGLEEPVFSSGMPLWHSARLGRYAMAKLLLERGADPNAQVYASGSPVFTAYGRRDWKMVELLRSYGGKVGPVTAGLYRETELARKMLLDATGVSLEEGTFAGETVAEQLLWAAACGGDPEIVRMALERVDWLPGDARWYRILEQPARFWNHMGGHWEQPSWDRGTYVKCFYLVLQRADPNVRGRFGLTLLHDIAASRRHVTAQDRLAFAEMLLKTGARWDLRDELLKSTALGWACRWGREELVRLMLAHGADPLEHEAEPWASPRSWAVKMGNSDILTLLRDRDST